MKDTRLITKPNLTYTLRVLHNLYSDGRLKYDELQTILKEDYNSVLYRISHEVIYVESLDGLTSTKVGEEKK